MARKWLVTGISSGLGKALFQALAAKGETVAGTTRRIGPESAALANGDNARLFEVDITDPADVRAKMAEITAWTGGLDAVINNAGTGMFGVVEASSIEDFRFVMDVNYFGTVNVCQATMAHLRSSKGALVNVSSMAGIDGFGGCGAYAASKYAVTGLTEALHAELTPLDVRVMLLVPGGYRTDFWAAPTNMIRESMKDVYGAYPCGQIAERSAEHFGKEIGDPDRLAALLIRMIEGSDPLPLYLVGGADGMAVVEAKHDAIVTEVETHRAASVDTAF